MPEKRRLRLYIDYNAIVTINCSASYSIQLWCLGPDKTSNEQDQCFPEKTRTESYWDKIPRQK